jgi:hypothetical protein
VFAAAWAAAMIATAGCSGLVVHVRDGRLAMLFVLGESGRGQQGQGGGSDHQVAHNGFPENGHCHNWL